MVHFVLLVLLTEKKKKLSLFYWKHIWKEVSNDFLEAWIAENKIHVAKYFLIINF
jgi:hypothetical protein